jgi:hypothetical protein
MVYCFQFAMLLLLLLFFFSFSQRKIINILLAYPILYSNSAQVTKIEYYCFSKRLHIMIIIRSKKKKCYVSEVIFVQPIVVQKWLLNFDNLVGVFSKVGYIFFFVQTNLKGFFFCTTKNEVATIWKKNVCIKYLEKFAIYFSILYVDIIL